ncbi:hypothetical protein WHR41_04007 [Cladosporium halotolerans]|uniref:Calcium-channel protein CCH1 n=1 Tax=Cladosporium halotolerans TaxID=1052096 RepID=A0AB34KPP2_9PEZI
MANGAEDSPSHRRNRTAQGIPLQTLNADGFQDASDAADHGRHRRTLSDRGRALFRSSRQTSPEQQRRYAPIGEDSPSPPQQSERMPLSPHLYVSSPSGEQSRIPDEDDEAPMSPVADRGAFQSAIGFAGLSFADTSQSQNDAGDYMEHAPPRAVGPPRATRDSLPRLSTSRSSTDDMVSVTLDDGPAFFSPGAADEDDTQPLTDTVRLRPSTLAAPVTPQGSAQGRNRSQSTTLSVRFPSGQRSRRSTSGPRLGDDLHNLEAGDGSPNSRLGTSPSSRKRSLSPASLESPFTRTGNMLRNMSQRVVNLSHEPELVEQAIRRKSSVKAIDKDRDLPPIPVIHPDGDMANDADGPSKSPASEKAPSPVMSEAAPMESHMHHHTPELPRRADPNPLRGKSLSVFSKHSKVRRALLSALVHPFVEPFILLLIVVQTIVLAIDSAGSIRDPDIDQSPGWGHKWSDYTLFAIFLVYTIETIAKIIVSGFIFNPSEYSTIDRSIGLGKALNKKANELLTPHARPSIRHSKRPVAPHDIEPPSLLRAMTMHTFDEVPGGSRQAQKKRLAHRAYLRHSFNRLDFVAVVSFWISFLLNALDVEWGHRLYVFKMMACLRILRLLNITSGTSVILRSLKRAAPSLLNIGILIGFFWLLFGIIGVQSFKSSLRRTCVWDGNNADPPQANYTLDEQYCGGWWAQDGTKMPWVYADGQPGATKHKGYLCPVGSYCVEGENPYNNTVSFDNVGNSLEEVFVIMTSNTFTDIMYYLADTDYLIAALYYAFGIVILYLWLLNLLVAVISSAFQVIREESRSSAFGAREEDLADEGTKSESKQQRRTSGLKRAYEKSKWFWIAIIVYGLVAQSMRHDTMGEYTSDFINVSELIVTLILVGEIAFRLASDWRDFPFHRRNWVDLGLAIITLVIQIPPIHNSGTPYAWLTFFQIVRIYRVVLAVPITRDLIMLVLRHVSGVLNLILFVFLLTFLAAIFATQLFRGIITDDEARVTFGTVFNSFLGMYQILSTEDWTSILYAVTESSSHWGTAWIGALFFILWFILANFITLNMFIAVIQENFDVSEDQKRLQQVRMFLQQKEQGSSASSTMSLFSIFKFGQARRQDPLDFGSAATEMLMKDAVVRDFLDEVEPDENDPQPAPMKRFSTMNIGTTKPGFWTAIWDKTGGRLSRGPPNPFYARLHLSKPYEELDPRSLAKEVVAATEVRKQTQRDYLKLHPNYNKSLFIFKPYNPIRKLCQRMVGPGRGHERIEGVAPNPTVWYVFSAFVYCAIVGMVLLACVTTPLYQKEYFEQPGREFSVKNWFVFTDIGFAALFTVEAIIKVIADGAFFTPNAYFRSSWGFIDGIVLCTLWASVITYLSDPGNGSRAVGAFKALRALRLLNVSDSARNTFHSLIVLGIWKLTSAALVSLSLLIPFAIYGLNLFAGQMQSCNDGGAGITNLTDCVGEYTSQPYNWDVLVPRAVGNDFYDFDSFGGALFILFQIVSQEGWVDVMWSGQSATGVFTQPQDFSTQGNAVYFVIFNLLGAVFILTLFVSVFMRNFSEQTGVAFLTAEQRSWLELRKLLRQVSPSKRPSAKEKRDTWQEWCYRRAVTKNGRWQKGITALLVVHLILLMLEFYPEPQGWSMARDYLFLLFTLLYIANIVIRIIGLSWLRFRRSAWDVYSLFAVSGTFITTLMLLSDFKDRTFIQFQKLFLVSVALMIIPRNNQLDQLFKTGAASLGSIVNLLATWFVFFLVFAIALTQTFGLTRLGDETSANANFRTVPKALILLFRTSVGEGWNALMEDFAAIEAPFCTVGTRYYDGDCGSEKWARALFISWNILSMYIFVNLFISLIYENFSYVYQRSSGLSIISREEIRRFKQAWAEFDPVGTGYISKEAFPRFLGELSGVFEMRVYDGDFTVGAFLEECQVDSPLRRTNSLPLDGAMSYEPRQLDLAKLNAKLNEIPVDEIQRRRVRMNTFYEEVLVSADPDRGIAFGTLLMILAHYKVINDNRSLKLEEFLRRRVRLQRVEEAVNRNIVVGFFDTLYWSRRFRRAVERKKSARMNTVPSFGVPEIFVQDEAGDDVTQAKKFHVPSVSITQVDPSNDNEEGLGVGRAPSVSASDNTGRPSSSWSRGDARTHRSNSIQTTPTGSPTRGSLQSSPQLSPAHPAPSPSQASIQPDWHFAAALENANTPPASPSLTGDTGIGGRSRANSSISQSGMMMDTFGTSAWGESMRRSVTTRRQTIDNNNRRRSSARQQSSSRASSAHRRPSAGPRQYSSSSRPPSPQNRPSMPRQYSSNSRPPSPQQ